MEKLLTFIALPVSIGALLAGGVVGGYVMAETAAPDFNPASQEILVYGE